MGVCAMDACAMGMCAMDAYAMGVCAIDACAMGVCTMDACAMHMCAMDACAMGVCAMDACTMVATDNHYQTGNLHCLVTSELPKLCGPVRSSSVWLHRCEHSAISTTKVQ